MKNHQDQDQAVLQEVALMVKRRKRRKRNHLESLTDWQELELILYPSKEPEAMGGANLNFQDSMEKRSAWFAFRDYLLNGFGAYPGTRPAGWWLFEKNQRPPMTGAIHNMDEWELLIEMDEMGENEKAKVLANWLHMRELVSLNFDHLEKLERQADLLAKYVNGGHVARERLEEKKEGIINNG